MAAEHPQHVSGARVQSTEASVHGRAPATVFLVLDSKNRNIRNLMRICCFGINLISVTVIILTRMVGTLANNNPLTAAPGRHLSSV